MDRYAEHLAHSAPCSSRWDGFDRGDDGREEEHSVSERVIGRMTNSLGQRVVITEVEVGSTFTYFSVSVNGEVTDWADERFEAIRLARLRMV